MAWWLQNEIDYERGKRVSYDSEWMGDSKARFEAGMAQVAAKMKAAHFTPDPGRRPWPASPYDTIHGSGPGIGFRQPMPDRPYQRRFKEKVGYLPDAYGLIVTSKIRDVIEALEPSVHQYMPCELYLENGTQVPEKRWYLNICNRLDSLAPEHCNIGVFLDTGSYYTGNGPTDVKVWKHKVAGHAIWSEWKYNNRTYVSDAFVEAIKARDVHGWTFRQYLPEV